MANALGWALGSHDLGREAADEAFARAYERWDTVDTMSNPAGWVYRVGLNWGRRRIWRRNKERQLLSTIDLDDQHDAYVDEDLAKALAALPIKFRSVVVLRHLLGYSERDTAEALGISPGTAKSRMSRGLERLRTHLETAS
ncbi:MAG: sigma factor-like helix-turn-helix DNA-binding protein [Acidimicrobiales bacterium]